MREIYNVREPLITSKPFRYLGREYKKGDIFDRRRVRLPHSRTKALIDKGCLKLAKNMPKKELEDLGYIYDNSASAYFPLFSIESYKAKYPEKFKPKKKVRKDTKKQSKD